MQIRVFSDGFILNRGPFRSFDEESNRKFISTIRGGDVPEELMENAIANNGQVPIQLTDLGRPFDPLGDVLSPRSKTEEARRDRPEAATFSGKGSVLGGSSSTAPSRPSVELGIPHIDTNRPTTSIQLRLPSGTRLVRVFNVDSFGSDIVCLVTSAHQIPDDSVIVSSGFPPRPISQADLNSKSLAELGVCGSSVTISFK
jgi:UBX domain-containing protein 1